jgi:hypothetical protein
MEENAPLESRPAVPMHVEANVDLLQDLAERISPEAVRVVQDIVLVLRPDQESLAVLGGLAEEECARRLAHRPHRAVDPVVDG